MSRERVLKALAHQVTDRVPRLLYEEAIGCTPPVARLLADRCAAESPRDYFGMDITRVTENPTRLSAARFSPWLGQDADAALASGQVDEWGVWWRQGSMHHFAHIESPLKRATQLRQLGEFPWPDLDQPYRFAGLTEQVQLLHAQDFAVAAFAGASSGGSVPRGFGRSAAAVD